MVRIMEEVKIIPTQYGRGVAANRSWKEGDIIRISECIYLPDNQMPLKSQGSALWAYVFSAAKEGVLVSLDWTSLMNHSEDNFNVEYRPTDDNKVIFKAARDINPGDELLINYGYDVVEHNKHFGIDTDKLNEDTLQGFDMSASQGGVGLSSVKMHSEEEGQELIDALHNLRDQLFDAPDNVKEEFNSVVRYFAAGDYTIRVFIGDPSRVRIRSSKGKQIRTCPVLDHKDFRHTVTTHEKVLKDIKKWIDDESKRRGFKLVSEKWDIEQLPKGGTIEGIKI